MDGETRQAGKEEEEGKGMKDKNDWISSIWLTTYYFIVFYFTWIEGFGPGKRGAKLHM